MASLYNEKLQRRITLQASNSIGRSSRSSLRIDDQCVSLDHASIRWQGDAWTIRDLGSLNRTFLDGHPLTPGESKVLREGSLLAFGSEQETWTLESASPPAVMAVPLDGGPAVVEEGGLLGLPSAEEPVVTLLRNADGAWELEPPTALPGGVVDNAVVEVVGRLYRISVPHVAPSTVPVTALRGSCIGDLTVHFRVSADLDDVTLVVKRGSVEEELPARSHFELLRVLARARRKEAAEGIPDPHCGWLHIEDLARDVRLDLEHVHVQIYRIRKNFSTLGLLDPARVIERRSRSRMVRFGVPVSTEGTW
jgi:hypothetical protein